MVGVLISVTTVPAAGNLALGLAVWEPDEITGSLAQLGANIGGMILAGTLFLALQRRIWTAAHPPRRALVRSGSREVAVGVVGGEAQPGVERQRRLVVAEHLEVRRRRSTFRAPLEQGGHHRQCRDHAADGRDPRRRSGSRPSRRRTPRRRVARSPIRADTTSGRQVDELHRTARAAAARGAPAPRRRSGTACPRRGSPPPTRGRGRARPRPSRAGPPRSVGRSGRPPARRRRRRGEARTRAPSSPAVPTRWGRSATASHRRARSPGPARGAGRAAGPGAARPGAAPRDVVARACRTRCRPGRSSPLRPTPARRRRRRHPTPYRCRGRPSSPDHRWVRSRPRRTRRTTTRWPTT